MIELCKNIFGYIDGDLQNRICDYIENPTIDKWDDICGIIIQPDGIACTIWQWIIYCDSTFPKTGRVINDYGKVIVEWKRIPTSQEIMRAINIATH